MTLQGMHRRHVQTRGAYFSLPQDWESLEALRTTPVALTCTPPSRSGRVGMSKRYVKKSYASSVHRTSYRVVKLTRRRRIKGQADSPARVGMKDFTLTPSQFFSRVSLPCSSFAEGSHTTRWRTGVVTRRAFIPRALTHDEKR
jgi:hypothetical protein